MFLSITKNVKFPVNFSYNPFSLQNALRIILLTTFQKSTNTQKTLFLSCLQKKNKERWLRMISYITVVRYWLSNSIESCCKNIKTCPGTVQ